MVLGKGESGLGSLVRYGARDRRIRTRISVVRYGVGDKWIRSRITVVWYGLGTEG